MIEFFPDIGRAALDTSRFLPNPEVVDELMISTLPREARAFILAASVETMLPGPAGSPLRWPYAWSQFRCLFGFVEWNGDLTLGFPNWNGALVPLASGGYARTHAAGLLQDEPATYRGIVRLGGDASFVPQSQLANNWTLAMRDFHVRTGHDLLVTLTAGTDANLAMVHPGLAAIWPEGADVNFPARYRQALTLFP